MENQQILVSVPQINNAVNNPAFEEVKRNEMKQKEKRFNMFGIGSFLYALFYTFCLYRNASGITCPFFAGGTLLFFGCYIKKSRSSSADGNSGEEKKAHINKIFLIVSVIIAGILNCMTDSGVLIAGNELLMLVLMTVLFLQGWHDLAGWGCTAYIKAGMKMFFGSIGNMFVPIGDMYAKNQLNRVMAEKNDENAAEDRAGRNRMFVSVVIGLVIAVPVALFIGLLLASADVVFYNFMRAMFTFDINASVFEFTAESVRILLCSLIVFAVCYGFFSYNTKSGNIKSIDDMAVKGGAVFEPYTAVTVNGVMCAIYLIFSVIQVFGLFLGKMSLPPGYTYAAYARQGFFQLVFVCIFNIWLVLFTLAYFKNATLLKILLDIICGCTYIMAASSAYRMIMYIAVYHLTFLRVFVLWALVMTVFVMTGVLVYIHNLQFPFFRYVLTVVTIGWLAFSALHPDYWIASYNVAAAGESQECDDYYLRRRLSLDAAAALPEGLYISRDSSYTGRVEQYKRQTKEFLGARRFNFSRAYAAYRLDNLSGNSQQENRK